MVSKHAVKPEKWQFRPVAYAHVIVFKKNIEPVCKIGNKIHTFANHFLKEIFNTK